MKMIETLIKDYFEKNPYTIYADYQDTMPLTTIQQLLDGNLEAYDEACNEAETHLTTANPSIMFGTK